MSKPEDNLANVIQTLAETIHTLTVERRNEFEWFKAHLHLATKQDLEAVEKRIMATQAELAADLRTANTQLRKLITDTAGLQPAVDALKAKIAELEALIAAGGTIGQELVDAVAETKSLVQTVDDNVPELPVAPPPPTV